MLMPGSADIDRLMDGEDTHEKTLKELIQRSFLVIQKQMLL